jgi:hypothetical protein
MEEAHRGVVGVFVRLEYKSVLRFSGVMLMALHENQLIAAAFDAVDSALVNLIAGFIQQQRLVEGITESDIGQPRALQLNHERHVIEVGIEPALFVCDAGRELFHHEAQLAEQPAEETIQLIAEPSSSPFDDLIEQSLVFKDYRAPEMNIEIFEWHGQEVSPVEITQSLGAWFQWPGVVDAPQVSIGIQAWSSALRSGRPVLQSVDELQAGPCVVHGAYFGID